MFYKKKFSLFYEIEIIFATDFFIFLYSVIGLFHFRFFWKSQVVVYQRLMN